jgi:hypothetical protein
VKVHRSISHSRVPDLPGDDVALTADHCVAVIDGVSDKSGFVYNWHGETLSSGRFAALVVADALTRSDPTTPPTLLVEQATMALHEAIADQQPDLPPHHWPSAVVVAYQPATGVLWRVGDCQWTYRGVSNIFVKEVDAVATGMRAALTEALLATGTSVEEITATDPGRASIFGLLCTQRAFANQEVPFGYGCINGTPVPSTYIETWNLEHGERLILTSDGYPVVLDTYDETEDRLAELMAADPLCIRELRSTKVLSAGAVGIDDRTWVELTT